ncbi:hypothetical protein KUTeg_006647 [Tegillarca granosa]|uniref:Uncharacterized protein n=1 Tax=Tegillarca granosa TaxID=220873 RepID=A0ABQ9FAX1_TEGGR|nr:hypothetical protein KUTeg_006647 [Tegillarca granosa]
MQVFGSIQQGPSGHVAGILNLQHHQMSSGHVIGVLNQSEMLHDNSTTLHTGPQVSVGSTMGQEESSASNHYRRTLHVSQQSASNSNSENLNTGNGKDRSNIQTVAILNGCHVVSTGQYGSHSLINGNYDNQGLLNPASAAESSLLEKGQEKTSAIQQMRDSQMVTSITQQISNINETQENVRNKETPQISVPESSAPLQDSLSSCYSRAVPNHSNLGTNSLTETAHLGSLGNPEDHQSSNTEGLNLGINDTLPNAQPIDLSNFSVQDAVAIQLSNQELHVVDTLAENHQAIVQDLYLTRPPPDSNTNIQAYMAESEDNIIQAEAVLQDQLSLKNNGITADKDVQGINRKVIESVLKIIGRQQQQTPTIITETPPTSQSVSSLDTASVQTFHQSTPTIITGSLPVNQSVSSLHNTSVVPLHQSSEGIVENLVSNQVVIFQEEKCDEISMTDESVCNWLMYLRPARSDSTQNILTHQIGTEIYFYAIKEILPEEELLFWYSKESKKFLTMHEREIHPNENPKRFHCEVCNQRFTSLAKFNIHVSSHTGVKPHACGICGKRFNDPSVKGFLCATCGKGFRQKAHLQAHAIVHTGKKNFYCEFCGKYFARQSDLKTHSYSHTQEKAYICPYCSKCFYKSQNYKRHMLVHSGERNFICDLCSKTFYTKYHRNRHAKTCKGPGNGFTVMCRSRRHAW